MKPLFGWVGSKARSAEFIIREFPTFFNNYYEPFLGSAAVYLNLGPCLRQWKHSFLSDANRNLVNCYKSVCDDTERVAKIVEHMCLRNSEEFYYEMRKQIASPSVFIYVMKAAFSSLYRENSSGEFNVPWRKSDFIKNNRKISADVELIKKFAEYVVKHPVTFKDCIWEHGLTGVNAGDVVYLDPPYLPYNDTGFVNYVAGGFNESDHIYLNNYAKQLKKKGCHVYLSNSISTASVRIFGNPTKIISLTDSVKAKSVDKGKREEGLWIY